MEENKVTRVVELRKTGSGEVVSHSVHEKKKFSPVVAGVRAVCFWVVILSTVILTLVGIMAVWTGEGEIFGKTLSTFLIVVPASGFIALIAPLLDKTEK